MIDTNDMAGAFARNVMIVKRQVAGLSHQDSLLQLPFPGNCLNWVVGHLVVCRDDILDMLGESPVFGDQGARYRRGSRPLTHADKGTLHLSELLDWLDRSQGCLGTTLQRIDKGLLSREVDLANQRMTLAQGVFFLYFHETYHIGQTEQFRQLAGRYDQIL